jgi:Bacterial PH domain/Short C-terminal domain
MADITFCKFCGASMRPGGKFCVNCGAAFEGTTVMQMPQHQTTKPKVEEANWVIEQVKGYLEPNEHVAFAVSGWYETKFSIARKVAQRQGSLIATDKRILFYGKRLLQGYDVEVFPYANINSIGLRKNFDGFLIEVDSFENTFVLRSIQNEVAERFIHYVQSMMRVSKSQTTAPLIAQGGIDVADQIRKLAELRDQGILTEEEFQAKKRGLLARL